MSDELRDLCARAVEGTLTPEQSVRLEELVKSDPSARRFLVEHLNLHAALVWSAGDPRFLGNAALRPSPARARVSRLAWAGWAVAACLVVGLAISLAARFRTTALTIPEFASLADAGGCKWESGTLPTETGARLGAGRIRLAEGVARIVFDNGAEIRLEGPADLEITSGWSVALHSGRLVARCPESAHGFAVTTPTTTVKDFGTEFGVAVGDGKTTDVQVFEGRVDVAHGSRTEELHSGRGMRFTPDSATALDPRAEGPRTKDAPPTLAPGQRLITITTATGRGRDGYIEGKPNLPNHSDVLLLVKTPPADKADYIRKTFIQFDLGPLAGQRIADAQLSFTQSPTGMGFASEVPDSTFTVYGVVDESLDDWRDERLTWENAPANAPGGAGVDPARTVKLGQFQVRQGIHTGVSSIGGAELAKFLARDTNGVVTLILVRDTAGSGRNDYVHGFAGRNHPTLPPPTLKLVVEGK
jgi:ferric-dicitrate binding protein FerR (iron transport regulator)